MADLDDLSRELDRWTQAGRRIDVWWRDDDATRSSPALERLVRAAAEYDLPLAAAVVPEGLGASLPTALADPSLTILQHGFAHRNHAAPGGRAVECGGDRPVETVLAELSDGRSRLADAFGDRFLPVMVPPWNRITAEIVSALPGEGYRGVSVFGPRDPAAPRPDGLAEINAHLDLLTWKGGARFAGGEKLVKLASERLADRRLARTDPDEPFGILTHHLDHDAETWTFLRAMLGLLARHPAVRWRSAGELFGAAAKGGAGLATDRPSA
ncbi:polysaccharide deacetylase family protein [Jiella sp. M17.18]|uniref:polysaccharide deacetylase family protein n=1 Tax=Jiella sp. M17.18 TaxID=3234247 RepID=UPI0034DF4F16